MWTRTRPHDPPTDLERTLPDRSERVVTEGHRGFLVLLKQGHTAPLLFPEDKGGRPHVGTETPRTKTEWTSHSHVRDLGTGGTLTVGGLFRVSDEHLTT